MSTTTLVAAGLLALMTYVIRYAGLRAAGSVPDSELLEQQVDRGIVVMLAAVAATSTLFDGQQLADPTRAAGVALGGTAALLRLPLLVVVLVAGGGAALLRLL